MTMLRVPFRLRPRVGVVLIAAALTGCLAVQTLGPAAASSSAAAGPVGGVKAKPTVVLVHGAWADTSSWNRVVAHLIAAGYPVRAFPTPLRSLPGDSAALRTFLHTISGPIVLVGHSYGGAVITNAAGGDPQVRVLVYIDAFAPAKGVPVIALPGRDSAIADPSVFQPVPLSAPTASTDLYVRQDVFAKAFANDMSATRGAILAATQRPVKYGALLDKTSRTAWTSIPSWYEVGTIDKVIPVAVQLRMAHDIKAHIVRVRTGHLPMVSDPSAVAVTIERAARATA